MEIRQSTDKKLISKFLSFVQNHHNKLMPERFKKTVAKDFYDFTKRELKNPNSYFFIGYDHKTPVSFLWVTLKLAPTTQNNLIRKIFSKKTYKEDEKKFFQTSLLRVEALATTSEEQDKGYGKLMLHFAEEFARDNDIDTVRLEYWTKNPVEHFYKTNGYEKIRVVNEKKLFE
jgi:GNAT superfamily N-acetyltransferase